MIVRDLIAILQREDPNMRVGTTYANSWGTYFNENLSIEEITVDSGDELENFKSKLPLTKVLEIS